LQTFKNKVDDVKFKQLKGCVVIVNLIRLGDDCKVELSENLAKVDTAQGPVFLVLIKRLVVQNLMQRLRVNCVVSER